MSRVISIINMKGGVGKSTLTVNIAHYLCAAAKRATKILVVDLDPQFNASQYLLGVSRYENIVLKDERPTVWDIFEQAARTPGLKASGRDLTTSIISVRKWTNGGKLDLIASQLELSYTLKNPSQKEHLLAGFLDHTAGDYDLVLIDCAPTESVLTTAAYLASQTILIPVKPEFLSTIGLPLIKQSLDEFRRLTARA